MRLVWACLLAAVLSATNAQNSTNGEELECNAFNTVLCCRSVECVVNRGGVSDVSNECLDAIVELDPRTGPSEVCFRCIADAFNTSSFEYDYDGSGGLNLADFIDQDKLSACCGFGCPDYWNQYFNVYDKCGNVFGQEGIATQALQGFREIIRMIEEECDVVNDWPFDPECAPRREESADEGGMKVCSADNDPHMSTFSGDRVTCNSTGQLTLLENDYFIITATADPVPVAEGAAFRGASIIKSVTFTYKYPDCSEFPNATSLTINPAYLSDIPHHTIREPRLWTTVTIEKFTMRDGTDFLSVQIITPYHEGPGICNGCPDVAVDPSSFFRRRSLLQPSQSQARQMCEDAGVEDDAFIETCIFDIMTTGDDTFTKSANATEDNYKLGVEIATQDNQDFDNAVSNSPSGPSPSPSPSPDGNAGAPGHSFSAVVLLACFMGVVAQLQAWDTVAPYNGV